MIKNFCGIFLLLFAPLAARAQQAVLSGLPIAPSQILFASIAQTTASSSQQDMNSPSQQPAKPQTEEERRAEAERELKKEESQRILGVIPNFNEVIGGQAVPLTPGQKFHLFFKGEVDPVEFVAIGFDAAYEQGTNQYPGYHQGWGGFAKRYGAAYADNFDGNFWGNAVLPSAFHQDPRYFRLGEGSFLHRLLYSSSTTIRTRGDNGRWQPNYSNVLGNFIGGGISNLYYPASDRGFSLTAERAVTVTAEGTFGAIAEEFYPDVAARFLRHKKKISPATPRSNTDSPS